MAKNLSISSFETIQTFWALPRAIKRYALVVIAVAAGTIAIGLAMVDWFITHPELDKPAAEVLFMGSSHVLSGIDSLSFERPVAKLTVRGMSQDVATAAFASHRESWPNLRWVFVEIDEFTILTDRMPREMHDLSELCGVLDCSVWDFPVPKGDWGLLLRRACTFLDGKGSSVLYEKNRISLPNMIPRFASLLRNKATQSSGKKPTELAKTAPSLAAAEQRVEYIEQLKAADPTKNTKALVEIVQLAEAEDLRVVFLSLPTSRSYTTVRPAKWNDALQDAMDKASLASGMKTPYWNYRNDSRFLQTDFKDVDHLNEIGAQKFSRILSERIAENLTVNF